MAEIKQTELIEGDAFTVSSTVENIWKTSPNFLVEDNEAAEDKDLCVIYFSSNGIYFPNNEDAFRKRIIERNHFDWYRSRVPFAARHIFVRDVFKQWYIKGISAKHPDPESFLSLLSKLTAGYKRVVTIGSSAGGYAATLYGCMLKASRILAFSPQFSIGAVLQKSRETANPVLREMKGTDRERYYDIRNIVNLNDSRVVYLFPEKSSVDVIQYELIKHFPKMSVIRFNSAKHGMPCNTQCIPELVRMPDEKIASLCKKSYTSFGFNARVLGLAKTIMLQVRQLTLCL